MTVGPGAVGSAPTFVPWERAWRDALYGADGFYRRAEGPAGHFRTATHAAPGPLAGAVAELADRCGLRSVIDVGAGRGELVTALAGLARAGRLDLHAVDVVERPAGLDDRITWWAGLEALEDDALDGALVLGWELLDVVPCPVAEIGSDGSARLVEVVPATGRERLAAAAGPLDRAWLDRWWPGRPGERLEVGRTRDELWAGLVARCARQPAGAVLVAVDYAHLRDDRPVAGSLVGYRAGRRVEPVPDGGCDLSADVALDAVAQAGRQAGATATIALRQREALRALGVGARPLTPAGHACTGRGVLAEVAAASQRAELLDPAGLGGFSWLVQATGSARLPDLSEPGGRIHS